jgi:general L-amino acid transport system substrate-binding protein
VKVIRQVGNYGEMYERNITPIGIPRGVNRLWTQGGLHYAPPLR